MYPYQAEGELAGIDNLTYALREALQDLESRRVQTATALLVQNRPSTTATTKLPHHTPSRADFIILLQSCENERDQLSEQLFAQEQEANERITLMTQQLATLQEASSRMSIEVQQLEGMQVQWPQPLPGLLC